MSQNKILICVDCKWLEDRSQCMHPDSMEPFGKWNLVRGNPPLLPTSAEEMRMLEAKCGPSGNLFKAKETT